MLPGLGPGRRIHRLLDALQPDVVHVQAEPTLIDARRHPSVLTVHGFAERDTLFADHGLRRVRSWVAKRLMYPARARFRHIIALTGYVRQQLESYCRRSEFHFVPNPVDSRFFDHRRTESGPVAFFAGRFRPLKNIHGLIEAVGLLARQGVACELRLAGPKHNDTYSAHLDELIVRHGLSDHVVFLGQLDREQLMREMSRARCVVLPSFQESSPMVLPEAGATAHRTCPARGRRTEHTGGLRPGHRRLAGPKRPVVMIRIGGELVQDAHLRGVYSQAVELRVGR
ncbi:hypothetical protein LCGC14_0181330 [marine sediment metagenome]|uniref:Glycosyl transferase family 1 domain-containing protein n=1 Tax=marine sediment metagenome TaxID=412755 RepID=A0A0F9UPJ6_9ZZZZ